MPPHDVQHGAHSLDHLRGARRSPELDLLLSREHEPWGQPERSQPLVMVVVKMGEKDFRHLVG
jgi:hypothetical protein